jgi:hypothetical protein
MKKKLSLCSKVEFIAGIKIVCEANKRPPEEPGGLLFAES